MKLPLLCFQTAMRLCLPIFCLSCLHAEETPDFNQRLTGWDQKDGTWEGARGELKGEGTPSAKILAKEAELGDFELEFEIRLDSPEMQAGVLFRTSEAGAGVDNFQGYYIGLVTGDDHVVWGAGENDWREIARKPLRVKPGEWTDMKIQAVGERITAYVNALPVAEGRFPKFDGLDSVFKRGGYGFRILDGKAMFRNLKLKKAAPLATGKTYTNPVQSDGADPVVLKHEGTYYLYCTYTPDFPKMVNGIRLYTSPDLVKWEDKGYVLKNADSWGDSRFWAPDIVEKDGVFYLYYATDERMAVATAKSPLGPFKQKIQAPMLPDSIKIDGHVFQDDDGQRYFYYVHFNGRNEIWGGKLNDDMMTVDESSLKRMLKPDHRWEEDMGRVVEGPEMIKHKGVYYLTYAGSHFESPNYGVGYATSTSPLGPWKKYEFNPIMKSTGYAHGTAHHCLTTSPDGSEMFIVYHRHNSLTKTEPRQLCIDRIHFVPQTDGEDILEVWGPTSSPQPIPSAK
ncbi:MAG: hypothetical protein RLZZ245_2282 [Verrucomicrobiota bacterium]